MSGPLYDFAKGHPNTNELPVAELASLFGRMQGSEVTMRRALQYGADEGSPDLLEAISAFLERQCAEDEGAISENASSFFVTEGVSHAISLLTVAVTEPGDVVLTERPTYYLVAAIFQDHGLNVDTLPMRQDSSIDTATLERELIEGLRTPPRMIYIIPANQNPTGRSMACADRRKLAEIAATYGILVVADEVYHLLDWGREEKRPSRMVKWNPPDTTSHTPLCGCVSLSGFTKIFSPGVRCGWIEADQRIIQAVTNVGYIQSQGGVGPVVGAVLEGGLTDHTVDSILSRLRLRYQERCNLLCDLLAKEPSIELICRPAGGYFVWVRFPESMGPVADFQKYCEARDVNFMPGPRCDACPDDATLPSLHSYARLCFVYMDAKNLAQGAERLLENFRSYMVTR